MPVSHDRLILSLLLCCSVPFVAARAIALEPLPSLGQSRSATDQEVETDQLLQEDHQLRRQRQNQAALEKLQQELKFYEKNADHQQEIKTLESIGSIYFKNKQFNNIEAIFRHKINEFIKLGDRQNAELIRKTLQRHNEVTDRPRNEIWTYDIYGSKKFSDDFTWQKRLELIQLTLFIRRETGDRIGEARALHSMGWAYHKLGRYSESLQFLEQGLKISRTFNSLRGKLTLGFTLTDSGRVSVDLGQYTRALTFLKEALQIHSEGNNSLQQLTLCYMGWAYTNLSQYSEASEFFQRALAVSSNVNRAETLNYRGLLYMRTGAYSKARQSFEQALVSPAPGDNPGLQGIYLNNLGLSHVKLNENSQALKSYQKALTLFQELDEQIGVREVLQNIAALLEQQKQSELAIVFYKKAVNLTEEIRQNLKKLSVSEQRTYTETVAKTYRSLANLLLSQDRILEAQQVLDLLKVQELDDYLRNVRSSAQTIRGIDNLLPEQAILDKYGELQKSAVQIGKELTDLRKISEAQRTSAQQQRIAQLVKIQADSDQQFNQFIDSKDVQALVDQLSRTARKQSLDLESLSALKDDLRKAGNAVLLYPLILDDRLELILTTPDSPPIRRTVAVKREELNRTIVEFRSALKNPSSDAKVPAQKLYDWLIKPLEADLKQSGSQTLIYAPDGQLRYIPLAALFDGKQWLVERYRINNITAKSLTNLNIKPPTQPKVLAGAFGSGRYSFTVGQTPFTFNGLLGAQKEVQLLTASFPGTTTLIDSKFSRDATTTKMNEYAIVHLATHAAFVTGDPSNSFVLFGNGDRASLVDIRNWDLTNVDLIVLSACETGLGGQFGNGEEVLGLGYVFQERGARAVLASLWTVDDGGTQVLMNAFYEQLKSGKVAKVEALRQAQLALINANNKTTNNGKRTSIEIEALNSGVAPDTVNHLSHPYYWAPFILIGNGL